MALRRVSERLRGMLKVDNEYVKEGQSHTEPNPQLLFREVRTPHYNIPHHENHHITREYVHMTPVTPGHSQTTGVWKSYNHGSRGSSYTLAVDFLMFSEEKKLSKCLPSTRRELASS
eukprot:4312800-Amphidinium_carterae.4